MILPMKLKTKRIMSVNYLYDDELYTSLTKSIKQLNELTILILEQLKGMDLKLMPMSIYSKTILLVFAYFIWHQPISVLADAPDPVRGKNGMVVSASNLASKVGLQILKEGRQCSRCSSCSRICISCNLSFSRKYRRRRIHGDSFK